MGQSIVQCHDVHKYDIGQQVSCLLKYPIGIGTGHTKGITVHFETWG